MFYELAEAGPDLLGRADGWRLAIYRLAGRHPGHLRNLHAHCASAISAASLAGRFILTAGLGGMGGAQPLAGRMAGAAILCVEIDPRAVR